MNIGVLGTGSVGQALASKLVELGHTVMMGSRSATNEKAMMWADELGDRALHGTFADAATHGEIVVLCVKGEAALDAVDQASPEHLAGKIVIDVTNPLSVSDGVISLDPELSNTNSLGEEIQRALPDSHVVKTLNMVTAEIMVAPEKTNGEPTMFIAGNDSNAKTRVVEILKSSGWKDVIDVGDITGARGMEMMLPMWLRLWQTFQHTNFGWKIVR